MSNGDDEPKTVDISVYDYYKNYRGMELTYSAELPCLNVGKPKRPTYIPLEVCHLS